MCEIVRIFPLYRCLSCSVAGIGSDTRLRKNPIFVIEIGACLGMCSIPRSCSTLWDPMDCSAPGSSAHGIFQPRILEWVAISSSRGSFPGIKPAAPALAGGLFTTEPPGKPMRLMVPNQMPSSQSLFHWGKPT